MIDFSSVEMIDISTDMYDGMLGLPAPMPDFALREIDLSEYARIRKRTYISRTQQVTMCVQSGTYLETGAHVFPEMEKISDVGLDRSFLSAVVLQVPTPVGQKITAARLADALRTTGETIRPGEAILVASGDNMFDGRTEMKSPHFSGDAMQWMLAFKPAIIGADMGGWQAPDENPPFFPAFLKTGCLLLAPLVKLDRIRVPRIQLIVLALKLRQACAATCRAIALVPRA